MCRSWFRGIVWFKSFNAVGNFDQKLWQQLFAFIEAEWSQRFPATLAIFMQFVIETHFFDKCIQSRYCEVSTNHSCCYGSVYIVFKKVQDWTIRCCPFWIYEALWCSIFQLFRFVPATRWQLSESTGWWFQRFSIFTAEPWGNDPIWKKTCR